MTNIMIDLETLGVDPSSSPIISIGACTFDGAHTFERNIKFESACEGRTINPDTIKWWFRQPDAARENVISGTSDMRQSLLDLQDWMEGLGEELCVWGNGVEFDIGMLKSVMSLYDIKPCWKFWNEFDVRTVCKLVEPYGLDKRQFKFNGVKHTALADAIHQAKYVSEMLAILGS